MHIINNINVNNIINCSLYVYLDYKLEIVPKIPATNIGRQNLTLTALSLKAAKLMTYRKSERKCIN